MVIICYCNVLYNVPELCKLLCLPLEMIFNIVGLPYKPHDLEIIDEDLKNQQYLLNLSATCKFMRALITPKIWQHVKLDITDEKKSILQKGYGLIPKAVPPEFGAPISFLNHSWRSKTPYLLNGKPEIVRDSDEFSNHFLSMRPGLRYVTVFSLISLAQVLSANGGPNHYYEARDRYILAICMTRPEMMPSLKDLRLEMMFDSTTMIAHFALGEALRTYKHKVDLTVMACFAGWPRVARNYPFIDLIEIYGLLPYVVHFDVPRIFPCNARASLQLTKVRGLKFHDSPELMIYGPSFITSVRTNITFLDVSRLPLISIPEYNIRWIPPTVKVLICNKCLLLPPREGEKRFRVFDNVNSLTFDCSTVDRTYFATPVGHQFYFRNLKELQVIRPLRKKILLKVPQYLIRLLSNLLSSNESLERFRINYIYRPEFEPLSKHFGTLKTFDYGLRLLDSESQFHTEFLSSTMQKWGPSLRRLNYDISVLEMGDQAAQNMPYLDYYVLRSQALKCKDLLTNSALFYFPKTQLPENCLFSETFKNSPDSGNFKVTDFCQFACPEVFRPASSRYTRIGLVSISVVVDFVRLRALVNKAKSS